MPQFALLSPRPAAPAEILPPAGSIDSPLIALFDSGKPVQEALRRAGVLQWRESSPGVVALAPQPGLRERLYAAGAMLVVG